MCVDVIIIWKLLRTAGFTRVGERVDFAFVNASPSRRIASKFHRSRTFVPCTRPVNYNPRNSVIDAGRTGRGVRRHDCAGRRLISGARFENGSLSCTRNNARVEINATAASISASSRLRFLYFSETLRFKLQSFLPRFFYPTEILFCYILPHPLDESRRKSSVDMSITSLNYKLYKLQFYI